jgi:hypothetical protein
MATRPTITMRIEITMATMGRRTKNFATTVYLFPFFAFAACEAFSSGMGAASGFAGP